MTDTYMIDKFMRWVQLDREAFARFCADPQGTVLRWRLADDERTGSRLPVGTERGRLSDRAAEALTSLDIEALYRAGAHPYMLWHLVVDVLTEAGWDRPAIIDHYRSAIADSGYPNFLT